MGLYGQLAPGRPISDNRGRSVIKNWMQKDGKAICIIPKNATTSIRNRIGNTEAYTASEAQRLFETRIVFARNPAERWVSAYTMFYGLNKDGRNGMKRYVPESATHNGYEAWVDFALEVVKSERINQHWHPQTILIDGGQTIVHRLEDIDEVWPTYFDGTLPDKMNRAGKHLETSDYRADDIKAVYTQDQELYDNAVQVKK